VTMPAQAMSDVRYRLILCRRAFLRVTIASSIGFLMIDSPKNLFPMEATTEKFGLKIAVSGTIMTIELKHTNKIMYRSTDVAYE